MIELDHAFIFTSQGAPAADRLREFGLIEGTPNEHPGQGTACRRFFFANAMLELLWVEDEEEARGGFTAALKLFERWRAVRDGGSPFGIILRPATAATAVPFQSWKYEPPTMPLSLDVAAEVGPEEPMWFYMAGGRRRSGAPNSQHISGLQLAGPRLPDDCVTARMASAGLLRFAPASDHLLTVEFDAGLDGGFYDFRPHLPLAFAW